MPGMRLHPPGDTFSDTSPGPVTPDITWHRAQVRRPGASCEWMVALTDPSCPPSSQATSWTTPWPSGTCPSGDTQLLETLAPP